MPALEAAFPVHSYEVDAGGTLRVPALAGYLQEIAGVHATALGVGIDRLFAQGLTWVLTRQAIRIDRPIVHRDVLTIETWPSGVDRLFALREFRVRGADGAVVARATSAWAVLDLATRRPLRPDRVLPAEMHARSHQALPPPAAERLPVLERWDAERRFAVRRFDIDVNHHVNNLTYLAWALEAAPEEAWGAKRVAALDVEFLAECEPNASVLSRVAAAGRDTWAHAVVREADGRELARVRSGWVAREKAPVATFW
jgi:medium-chain acyl-[acyl-carrier-protein] hydrolase